MQDYRRLKVWEKAHAFALGVHRTSERFPRRAGSVIAGQLRRASLSIPANIAEGAAKGSDAEFRRFLHIAMGSALEADYHLLIARDTGLLSRAVHDELSSQDLEIRRMLGGLIKRLTECIGDRVPRPSPSASSDVLAKPSERRTE